VLSEILDCFEKRRLNVENFIVTLPLLLLGEFLGQSTWKMEV
jgi:hypothetical protein